MRPHAGVPDRLQLLELLGGQEGAPGCKRPEAREPAIGLKRGDLPDLGLDGREVPAGLLQERLQVDFGHLQVGRPADEVLGHVGSDLPQLLLLIGRQPELLTVSQHDRDERPLVATHATIAHPSHAAHHALVHAPPAAHHAALHGAPHPTGRPLGERRRDEPHHQQRSENSSGCVHLSLPPFSGCGAAGRVPPVSSSLDARPAPAACMAARADAESPGRTSTPRMASVITTTSKPA